MSRLFLPQSTLETWALEDRVDLSDDRLLVPSEGKRYPVTPAVRFRTLVVGEDAHGLLAKVKTAAQLDALAAEQMADSVLIGETAYEVEPGYVVTVDADAPARAPAARAPTAAPVPKPGTDADLLAEFLSTKP